MILWMSGKYVPLTVSGYKIHALISEPQQKAGYAQLAEVMVLELQLTRELVGAGEVSVSGEKTFMMRSEPTSS